MSSDNGVTLGYAAIVVAAIFFGSNYVPVKKYPTGPDGMYFQWMLCTGILIVGFFTLPLQSDFPVLAPSGFLGGGLWATGNLMVVPIINRVGLAIGILLYCEKKIFFCFFFFITNCNIIFFFRAKKLLH
jgi:hypothetical protein